MLPLILLTSLTIALVSDPCIVDSSAASCTAYSYPDASSSADVANLCDMMPNMVGCSILSMCSNGTISSKSKYCHPFSILADICAADTGMSAMRGCYNYNALCKSGSVVAQCSSSHPVPGLPTTFSAEQQTISMCKQMSMTGCATCQSSIDCADPFAAFTQVCMEMPGMSGCFNWKKMCAAVASDGELANFEGVCGSTA